MLLGFLLIILTRYKFSAGIALLVLSFWHGIAGLIIFFLPLYLSLAGMTSRGFIWVGLGGALIGVAGLLLTFLKSGSPILSKETLLTAFPGILFLMTLAFVLGFAL